jgi:hypothetical protein
MVSNVTRVAAIVVAFVVGSGLTTYSLLAQQPCSSIADCAFTFSSCSKHNGSKYQSTSHRCTSYCGTDTSCKCVVYTCGTSGQPTCSPQGTDLFTDECDGVFILCPCDLI